MQRGLLAFKGISKKYRILGTKSLTVSFNTIYEPGEGPSSEGIEDNRRNVIKSGLKFFFFYLCHGAVILGSQ